MTLPYMLTWSLKWNNHFNLVNTQQAHTACFKKGCDMPVFLFPAKLTQIMSASKDLQTYALKSYLE